MIHYTSLAFRQGDLEGFDAVVMHVSRAIPSGYRVCELYAGVGLLGLTPLSYHRRMSKVEEEDDYSDYRGGGLRPLRWIRCSDDNPANPRCFNRAVGSMSVFLYQFFSFPSLFLFFFLHYPNFLPSFLPSFIPSFLIPPTLFQGPRKLREGRDGTGEIIVERSEGVLISYNDRKSVV